MHITIQRNIIVYLKPNNRIENMSLCVHKYKSKLEFDGEKISRLKIQKLII